MQMLLTLEVCPNLLDTPCSYI